MKRRLLYIPIFNFPRRLSADSIFLISNDWCKALVEADQDLAIYRFMPAKGTSAYTSFNYTPRKIHPRVHDIPVPMFTFYAMEEAHVPFEHVMDFHPLVGRRVVDGVICTSAVKTAYIYTPLNTLLNGKRMQTFFNFELLIRSLNGTNEAASVTLQEACMQAFGESVGINLFESPKCERIALDNARLVLAPSLAATIPDRSHMAFSGYPSRRGFEQEEKFNDFTVIVRGRLAPSKNIDKILETVDRAYRTGLPVRLLMTTGESRQRATRLYGAIMDRMSNLEFVQCRTADEASGLMRKAHAFLFWSTHELFAVSVWEMLASGLIGIFKRADWFVGLLPDSYPFIFDTDVEAHIMLAHVCKNYAAVKEELKWIPTWVRDRYEYGVTTKATAKLIRDNCPPPCSVREWLPSFIEKHVGNTTTYAEVEGVLEEHSDMGKTVVARRLTHRTGSAVGRHEIRQALLTLGYKENLEMVDPEWIRNV